MRVRAITSAVIGLLVGVVLFVLLIGWRGSSEPLTRRPGWYTVRTLNAPAIFVLERWGDSSADTHKFVWSAIFIFANAVVYGVLVLLFWSVAHALRTKRVGADSVAR